MRTWEPILSGALRDRALEALHDIAIVVRWPEGRPVQMGLAAGAPGLALFHGYHAAALGDEASENTALDLLQATLESLDQGPEPSMGLFSGLAGVGWTIEHLRAQLLDPDDDPLEPFDGALERHAAFPEDHQHDLLGGLTGLGLYALERRPRAAADRLLVHVIDRLRAAAEVREDGVAWLSAPRPRAGRSAALRDHDLGVAHGIPGVIGLLGRVVAAGVAADEARDLLRGAVRWLANRRTNGEGGYLFPNYAPVDGPLPDEPSRAAWCYGDPGVACALLLAAPVVDEASCRVMAIESARLAALRRGAQTRIESACLCHGAAGLAHMFNRIYQNTRDELFREAALYWFEDLLVTRRAGDGVAGFAIPRSEAPDEVERLGFLLGVAGVGLTLLGAVSPTEPSWDRVLMLSGG